MSLSKTYNFVRWLIYTLEFVFLYALEQSPFLIIPYFNVKPVLILSLFVFIALFEKEFVGMSFGILTGFLFDLGFGIPIGLNALAFCVLGYFLGVLSTYFINVEFWVTWLFCIFISGLVITLRLYISYGFVGFENINALWLTLYLPVFVYSILIAPLIILINRTVFYSVHGMEVR